MMVGMSTKKSLTAEQFMHMLKHSVDYIGSQAETARRMGISPQYLSDILRGNREPSESVAKLLGYERGVVFWRR